MIQKNNISFFFTIFSIIFFVAIYQLPSLENNLGKYGYITDINSSFPYIKNFQQNIENKKIDFISFFTTNNATELDTSTTLSTPIIDAKNSIVLDSNEPPLEPIDKQYATFNPTITNNSCKINCVVLMLGDSVMGDVGFSLQRLLKKHQPTWTVINAHKVSSGLSNQTYYNWPATAQKLVSQYKPDYTFILMGTNDAQGFSVNGKTHFFGKEDWKIEYKSRITQMVQLLDSHGKYWGWIQLPLVKDNNFNTRLEIIRQLQETNVKEHFINTEGIFGKTDHSQIVDMKLRANDGTHLNATGANKLAQNIIDTILVHND